MDSREVTMDRIKKMLDMADDRTLREIERMVMSWMKMKRERRFIEKITAEGGTQSR